MDTTQEELAAEQAALAEQKEDEVRAKVIEEFGFDPETDQERIDKLVADKVESGKKLSAAIGQKIKWRDQANKPAPPASPPPAAPTVAPEDIGKVVAQELEKRDLEALDYADDLKKEIQRIAQVQGISIKQAARDPYIVFKIGEYEKEQRANEATISRTHRSSSSQKFDPNTPPDVDMTTEEGRKAWDEWKAKAAKEV